MNIIFLRRKGRARQLNLARPLTLSVVAALTLLVLGGAFALGLQYGLGAHQRGMLSDIPRFGNVLAEQKKQLADLKQQPQLRVDAMAMRLATMSAHVLPLDALGPRHTAPAALASRPCDVGVAPA